MTDPYFVLVDPAELRPITTALHVLDAQAELNHRYRKLIVDSRELLTQPHIRLTQARGIAKKLLVLVKASGPEFPDSLDAADRAALSAGVQQAEQLIRQARPE